MYAILAIKTSWASGYKRVWLECDSSLICQVFSSSETTLWNLKGKWRKCMKSCDAIEFKISPFYYERNNSANKLVNFGIDTILDFKWLNSLPHVISLEFLHNRCHFHLFHFV